jgi:hypothetical protein
MHVDNGLKGKEKLGPHAKLLASNPRKQSVDVGAIDEPSPTPIFKIILLGKN